jgi:hypothetical protein
MSNLQAKESDFLERVRVALTNAESHKEIKSLIAEFGMDSTEVAIGWKVYNKAKDAWILNTKEDGERKIASNDYKKIFSELDSLFKRHRDFVLIYFKKQPDILISLGVKGSYPSTYSDFFDKSKMFYQTIKDDKQIQNELKRIKITPKIATDCLLMHNELLSKRANYDKEDGESQDSTVLKNIALIELKEWIEDFDAIAKIALYDKPQLLEVLGIFVRS